jgi:cysteine sulfinate desulfinase/cysteine desulfurase-like protein
MGYDAERARGLVRLSLGRFNTQQEVDRFLEILPLAVGALEDAASHHQPSRSIDALSAVLVGARE